MRAMRAKAPPTAPPISAAWWVGGGGGDWDEEVGKGVGGTVCDIMFVVVMGLLLPADVTTETMEMTLKRLVGDWLAAFFVVDVDVEVGVVDIDDVEVGVVDVEDVEVGVVDVEDVEVGVVDVDDDDDVDVV